MIFFFIIYYMSKWRRKWQPTPVFLPGKSHRQRSLVGYSPWGHKKSDTSERLHFHFLARHLVANIWTTGHLRALLSCYCCILTCIQISQEAGNVVWYSHLFKNFPQSVVIHTVKGFHVVSKAEIVVFLELSCFFSDPVDVGYLISGSYAFSKPSLNIWKFTVHILLKPCLENFKYYFISMWDECNCAVVWAFFGIAFLWD